MAARIQKPNRCHRFPARSTATQAPRELRSQTGHKCFAVCHYRCREHGVVFPGGSLIESSQGIPGLCPPPRRTAPVALTEPFLSPAYQSSLRLWIGRGWPPVFNPAVGDRGAELGQWSIGWTQSHNLSPGLRLRHPLLS
jgi:hypothetical protein